MEEKDTRGSTLAWKARKARILTRIPEVVASGRPVQRVVGGGLRAIRSGCTALRGATESGAKGDSNGANVAVPDGGRERVPSAEDPEETRFVWGQTRERPSDRDREAGGSPGTELDPIEDHLDELAGVAQHLSILATNANLKLARDEPDELAGIAYDVEIEARTLRRAIDDLETRFERLRSQLDEHPSDAPGADTGEQSAEDGAPNATTGQEVTGRTSVQLPAGDRQPAGPWRTAGVDLTNWPGHLGRVDFELVRRRVTREETVASGRVPTDVAEYSLDDGELSFESVLSLASAGGLGPLPSDEGADTGVDGDADVVGNADVVGDANLDENTDVDVGSGRATDEDPEENEGVDETGDP